MNLPDLVERVMLVCAAVFGVGFTSSMVLFFLLPRKPRGLRESCDDALGFASKIGTGHINLALVMFIPELAIVIVLAYASHLIAWILRVAGMSNAHFDPWSPVPIAVALAIHALGQISAYVIAARLCVKQEVTRQR